MIYDRHSYDGEKREALVGWGRRVEAITSCAPGAQVVELHIV